MTELEEDATEEVIIREQTTHPPHSRSVVIDRERWVYYSD